MLTLKLKYFMILQLQKKKKGRELSKPQCEQRILWLRTDGGMQARGVTEEADGKGPASPSSPWRGDFLFPGQLSKRIDSKRTPVPHTERPYLVPCKDRAYLCSLSNFWPLNTQASPMFTWLWWDPQWNPLAPPLYYWDDGMRSTVEVGFYYWDAGMRSTVDVGFKGKDGSWWHRSVVPLMPTRGLLHWGAGEYYCRRTLGQDPALSIRQGTETPPQEQGYLITSLSPHYRAQLPCQRLHLLPSPKTSEVSSPPPYWGGLSGQTHMPSNWHPHLPFHSFNEWRWVWNSHLVMTGYPLR